MVANAIIPKSNMLAHLQHFIRWVFIELSNYRGQHEILVLMCFQVLSDPRFSFLNSFKLNLEKQHLACEAHRVTKTYFWETPLFVNEAQIPCTKE